MKTSNLTGFTKNVLQDDYFHIPKDNNTIALEDGMQGTNVNIWLTPQINTWSHKTEDNGNKQDKAEKCVGKLIYVVNVIESNKVKCVIKENVVISGIRRSGNEIVECHHLEVNKTL